MSQVSMAVPNTVAPGATNGMTELLHISKAREMLGVNEIPGPKHEPKVVELWKEIGLGGIKDDETAWCTAFVGAMLKRAGLKYLVSGLARNYTQYVKQTGTGVNLDKPCYGCIVVFYTGKSPKEIQGHIGFCVGIQKGTNNLMILGGNQSNKVSIAPFKRDKVLAYIWPNLAPTAARYQLPELGYSGGVVTTR